MRTFTAATVAMFIAFGASGVTAQPPPSTVLDAARVTTLVVVPARAPQASPASPAVTDVRTPQAGPRIELGGGVGDGFAVSSWGTGGLPALANARVGVAVSPKWAIEGAFDIDVGSVAYTMSLYRVQARWQFAGRSTPGALRTHLTIGAAGLFEHLKYDGWEWRSPNGTVYSDPGYDRWEATWPIYPTVGIGVQKTFGKHIALRADVSAIVMVFDDAVGAILLPNISVSFPIGRYAQ